MLKPKTKNLLKGAMMQRLSYGIGQKRGTKVRKKLAGTLKKMSKQTRKAHQHTFT